MQIGKTSAFIGPFVSSAIITSSGNNDNYPFVFLFTLYVYKPRVLRLMKLTRVFSSGTLSTVFLYFVDVGKSRMECEEFLEAELKRKAFEESV